MTEKEYEKIICREELQNHLISVDDLQDKQDRTLLYGYTVDRNTWHVYLKDGNIYIVIYNMESYNPPKIGYNIVTEAIRNEDYIPNKRLYPEACDYEFCQLLKSSDVHMPFTTYNKERSKNQYYGYIIEDLPKDCSKCTKESSEYCKHCHERDKYERLIIRK